jgi:hypothetical protein
MLLITTEDLVDLTRASTPVSINVRHNHGLCVHMPMPIISQVLHRHMHLCSATTKCPTCTYVGHRQQSTHLRISS